MQLICLIRLTYLFIDEYLYRIKSLKQYIHYKNINTVLSLCILLKKCKVKNLFIKVLLRLSPWLWLKEEPDTNPYRQIPDICRRNDSKLRKKNIVFIHRFLRDRNVISTPRGRDSKCLNVDATSHESLELKKFSNEIV